MTNEFLSHIETELKKYLEIPEAPYAKAAEAMAYSAEAGGKRIRPLLVLEFARLAGGKWEDALPFACAVEMIHTYSLIHDDLPCMDNDDFRRGKPSCHKQFGEATALLAGDGLLTRAFGVLAEARLPADWIVKAAGILSHCAGIHGMIGGQVLDLQNEERIPTAEELDLTCRLKTGALLQSACLLGGAAAGADDKFMNDAAEYGLNLGIAFQIIDDILDVTSDEATLGKSVGSDAANDKGTFVSVLGIEKARSLAAAYTEQALQILSAYAGSENLIQLTKQLLIRKY